MSFPLVSIITPSYNQAAYLEQTMRSVLGQAYPHLQYLVVDGGSTDGSVDLIRAYENRLSWWVSEPDRGQGDAINKGFAHAAGDIIAWLNSDDVYAPGAVAHAVQTFEQHPRAGLVYGRAVSITPEGRPLNDLAFGQWTVADLAAFNILTQPAVFIRRAAWEQAGGLDPSYHLLLDHHLWLRIASQFEMVGVPEVWAFARHHPAAKNVAQAEKFGQEAFRLLDWMQTDAFLAPVYARAPRKIRAAALRFSARYLLDGGRTGPAFATYLRSLTTHVPTALVEWHRILFAGLSLVGFGRLGKLYYQAKSRRAPASCPSLTNIHELIP
ncbi:MAG: glycosyltransferase family 2 protein [Anaerolineales bacterium]